MIVASCSANGLYMVRLGLVLHIFIYDSHFVCKVINCYVCIFSGYKYIFFCTLTFVCMHTRCCIHINPRFIAH